MQTETKRGKILAVRDGYLICPICRRNRRLMKIRPDTSAQNLVVFCRECKNEFIVDISKGQSLEGRSR